MDRNDNNNICESVQLELITVKAELKQEPIENVDITEPEVHTTQNLNVTIDNSNDSSVSGQKRKHFEDNSLNVQEDETMSDTSNTSKSIVKRRRYSDFQNEESVANSEPALPEPNTQEMEESRPFTLLVTNSPGDWTSQEVIDYIKEQVSIFLFSLKANSIISSLKILTSKFYICFNYFSSKLWVYNKVLVSFLFIIMSNIHKYNVKNGTNIVFI